MSVPARMVLGSDGSTATLQILPDPRPVSWPVAANPAWAAETWVGSAPNPVSRETPSMRAPSDRRRRRAGSVAGGHERLGR